MAARDDVISFCDQLLEIDSFGDYGPNGLQVPGSAEVVRVAIDYLIQLAGLWPVCLDARLVSNLSSTQSTGPEIRISLKKMKVMNRPSFNPHQGQETLQ